MPLRVNIADLQLFFCVYLPWENSPAFADTASESHSSLEALEHGRVVVAVTLVAGDLWQASLKCTTRCFPFRGGRAGGWRGVGGTEWVGVGGGVLADRPSTLRAVGSRLHLLTLLDLAAPSNRRGGAGQGPSSRRASPSSTKLFVCKPHHAEATAVTNAWWWIRMARFCPLGLENHSLASCATGEFPPQGAR